MENPATTKAGRNAIVTSMIVCCGFLVCWSFGDIAYFLPSVGVTVNLPLWFYHFTGLSLLYNTNSLASNASTCHFLYTSSLDDLSNIFVLPLHQYFMLVSYCSCTLLSFTMHSLKCSTTSATSFNNLTSTFSNITLNL